MQSFLEWLTDAGLAESIAGDLEEQRRRRATRSRVLAEMWFWRRSLAMFLFFGRTRMQAWVGRILRNAFAGPGGIGSDLKYSLRALRRAPWYALTVIGVIAISMTLATTVFAVVDGVLFKPLPYPDADRLVAIETGFNNLPPVTRPPAAAVAWSKPRPGTGASVQDIAGWQAAAPGVQITGIRANYGSAMGEGLNESGFFVGFVQPNFFETIGVPPMAGGLVADDFAHDDKVVPVVITYELWQSRFQRANDIVGRTFINDPIGGRGFRVAGVMPRGFVFPSETASVNFIAPFVPRPSDLQDPTRRTFGDLIARLPQGMSASEFRARVEAGMATTAAAVPPKPRSPGWSDRGWRMQGPTDHADIVPLATHLGSTERPLFLAIFLTAMVLVALGGLNVSGLMAARGLDRARELSLRRVLGASGVRLARLIFLEALVPMVIAAAIGLALAVPVLRFGVPLLPENLVMLTPHLEPAIDVRVVMFVVLGAIALAVAATVWPMRRALRTGASPLDDASRGSTRTRSIGRTVVVVSQVAGALVLTMGGALLVTSIMAVYANTPAIRTEGIVVLRESMLRPSGFASFGPPERTTRANALLETLRRVPGVDGVALTEGQVLDGGGGVPGWRPPPALAMSRLEVVAQAVSSDFYRVLEPQLVMGRFPTDAETESDAPVIVVSESVARTYWPNASPIGQTLNHATVTAPFVVVGVVKDVRWNYWDQEIATIYGPFARVSRSDSVTVFIRTRKSAGQITAEAIQAIAAFDPLIKTSRSGTLDEWFAETVRPRRFQSWLFGSFAVAALVIVGAGILGLIAMSTARRTREMGIRLALGSTREGLVRLLLREQFTSVAAGVVVGSLISAWAVRFVRAYLYEITPYDPRVWAAAIVVIVLTTAAGTLIPSLRASKTDPVEALRVE